MLQSDRHFSGFSTLCCWSILIDHVFSFSLCRLKFHRNKTHILKSLFSACLFNQKSRFSPKAVGQLLFDIFIDGPALISFNQQHQMFQLLAGRGVQSLSEQQESEEASREDLVRQGRARVRRHREPGRRTQRQQRSQRVGRQRRLLVKKFLIKNWIRLKSISASSVG